MSQQRERKPHRDDSDLVVSRTIEAARADLFEMWTDPAHLECWWGPAGAVSTRHEVDGKTGGVWRFDMTMADGTVCPGAFFYKEFIRPQRLMIRSQEEREGGPGRFQIKVTFNGQGGGTRLQLRLAFFDPAKNPEHDAMRRQAAQQGLEETLARLEKYAAQCCEQDDDGDDEAPDEDGRAES